MVAWRVIFLMRLGRTCPDLPADLVFDPMEWKASFRLGEKALPEGIPTLNQYLDWLFRRAGLSLWDSDSE